MDLVNKSLGLSSLAGSVCMRALCFLIMDGFPKADTLHYLWMRITPCAPCHVRSYRRERERERDRREEEGRELS